MGRIGVTMVAVCACLLAAGTARADVFAEMHGPAAGAFDACARQAPGRNPDVEIGQCAGQTATADPTFCTSLEGPVACELARVLWAQVWMEDEAAQAADAFGPGMADVIHRAAMARPREVCGGLGPGGAPSEAARCRRTVVERIAFCIRYFRKRNDPWLLAAHLGGSN